MGGKKTFFPSILFLAFNYSCKKKHTVSVESERRRGSDKDSEEANESGNRDGPKWRAKEHLTATKERRISREGARERGGRMETA